MHLIEIMPWTTSDALAKRMKPNENAATLLDKFVASKGGEEAEDSGEEDIIMNEDGTMGMAIE
jgi:DNA polymerase epsilon subunit 4